MKTGSRPSPANAEDHDLKAALDTLAAIMVAQTNGDALAALLNYRYLTRKAVIAEMEEECRSRMEQCCEDAMRHYGRTDDT